ncbi:MAG: flagellar biosynthetic protein FliO [Candidatus Anammoxibacter sp.]
MQKILITTVILLVSLMLWPNLGFGDDKTEEAPVTLEEVQESGYREGLFSNDMPSIGGLVRSFAIVIGLILIFFVFLRWRYGTSRGLKGGKRYIQVLEHSMLGPKRYLYLVKVLDKLLVVGTTNDGMSLLCEMDETEKKELLDKPVETSEGFSSFLKKISRNKKI